MPTKTSTASGLWSAGGTWVGGIAPVDDDTVVIAAGHVVDMDVDITGWANGVNGLTITSHATTPGELRCYTGAPGKKGFKLKANTQIVGTNLTAKGIFRAGTSLVSPLANNIAFEVILGGNTANTMSQVAGQYLDHQIYCCDPTIKYVQLTSAAIVGDTVLNVDQDVTADATMPWAIGDTVVCCNAVKTGTRTSDVKTLAGVSATTITLSAGLTYALPQYSVIAISTRNVRFLIDSNVSSAKYAFLSPVESDNATIRCEVRNRLWTGGTGTHYATSGVVGFASGYSLSGASVLRNIEIGGVVCGTYTSGFSGGNRQLMRRQVMAYLCGDVMGDYQGSLNADILYVGHNYTGTCQFIGRIKCFCSARGMERTWGRFDSGSRIEWCGGAIGASTFAVFWDGTIANCNTFGNGHANCVYGTNTRMGAGCTTAFGGALTTRTTLYGCRINHATPISGYAGHSDPDAWVIAYDYADSSDVPQYGQHRIYMGAGKMEPDTTPASPPSWFTGALCNKMSLESANLELFSPPISITLEAGTPLAIQIAHKLGGAGYSWTQAPVYELFDPAYSWDDISGIVATAVDSNGAAPNSASTSWQTLYLDYTLPVASNRPRGSKQNFVIRARARVSSASGTPYWHWNYTQSPIVNANVVSLDDDALDQIAEISGGSSPFVLP